MVQFHEDDVQEVNGEQHVDGVVIDLVANHEVTHQRQVDHEEQRISSGDPPVDTSVLLSQRVKHSLDEQSVKGALLHSCLDTNVRNSEENAIHHDEALCSGVGESQQGGIHHV
jgi:hypothetical protein